MCYINELKTRCMCGHVSNDTLLDKKESFPLAILKLETRIGVGEKV